jgi:hypothetical protein
MPNSRGAAWLPVFGVVFPTVVGGGILALPVALAPLGPLLAVAVTIGLGIVNILTIGLLALTVSRRADSIPDHARLATLAGQLLGRRTGRLTTALVGLLMLGFVVVYALGLSQSLASTAGLTPTAWAVLVLVGSVLLVGFQRRRALMTAGSTVTIVNLLLLAALLVLLGRHVQVDLLTGGPPKPLELSSFTLVFGALMGSFFGHTSVPTIAPAALRSDPSGRGLVTGSVAAMAAATVVNAGWVFVTLGSTPAAAYESAGSTGVDLVRAVGGPLAGWLALGFVLLALGFAGMISAFVLGDLAVEQLPVPRTLDLDLSSGTTLVARDGPPGPDAVEITITATPDGDALIARARSGRRSASSPVLAPGWDAAPLLHDLLGRRPRRWLRLRMDDPGGSATRLHITSTMVLAIQHHGSSATTRVLDDGPAGRMIGLLTRKARTADELATVLNLPVSEVTALLDGLSQEGTVDRNDDGMWHVHLGQRHTIVAAPPALAVVAGERVPLDLAPRSPAWLATSTAARVLAILPLLLALGLVLLLDAFGATFAGVFSLIGIGTLVFVGTSVPLLLAIASRRNADRVVRARLLAVPSGLIWALWAATTATCGLYAALIHQSAPERIAAAAAAALAVAAAWMAGRAQAFRGSSALVVVVDEDGLVRTRLTVAGVEADASAPRHLPPSGRTLAVSIDTPLASPVRLLLDQREAPRGLSGPQPTAQGKPLEVEPYGPAGSGLVRLDGHPTPVVVTWRVH